MAPSIRVLGAFTVELTPKLLAKIMRTRFGRRTLSASQRADAEIAVREELAHLALLEVLIDERDTRFDVEAFGQPDSDQAPYDERFLSEDGSRVVADAFDVPADLRLRLVFFLHYFDASKPLNTCYGDVHVPELQPMPGRLHKIISYDPVD